MQIFEIKYLKPRLIFECNIHQNCCDLGQFLTQKIQQDETTLELAFVWNRSKEILFEKGIDTKYILEDLEDCGSKTPDLIVEVAHPLVVEKVC